MAFLAENSTEHTRFIKPRNRNQPITPPNPKPKTHIPKSNPSTLFSSIFSSSSSTSTTKMNKFTSLTFTKFGCGTLSPASAPEVIRSAADWEAKKARKQKRRKKKRSSPSQSSSSAEALKKTGRNGNGGATSPVAVEVVSDVFCAPPGIGFSSDAAFVDCVEPRRPVARRKHRKHSGTTSRRDHFPVLDFPYQHFPRGLSQNLMYEGLGFDHFGELRLDVDNMSYEELLDLSDKIGFVGTGLREEKIFRCLRKARLPDLESIPLLPHTDLDFKCSICQDEYEADDEVGKLDCGHCYHIGCIKPWLLHKNSCPICKAAADTGTA